MGGQEILKGVGGPLFEHHVSSQDILIRSCKMTYSTRTAFTAVLESAKIFGNQV
jgi:hypothetical protein